MKDFSERCRDACQSIPSSSPLKAPRIKQRKRGPLLSLSLLADTHSLCLSPSSLLLCAQVWALTRQLRQQLLTGKKCRTEKPPQVRRRRRKSTYLRAPGSGRVAEKVWEGTSSFFVVESPFVYTCDRWMGLLLAAPSSFRSPKSPALSKSNYAHKNETDRK